MTADDDENDVLTPLVNRYSTDKEIVSYSTVSDSGEICNDEVTLPENMTPSVQRVYGLWPRKLWDYIHMLDTVIHHVITQ